MGALRVFSALQRLVGRQEEDISSIFEFRPLGQKGVRLFSSNTVLPIEYHQGLSVKDVCEQAARKVGILPVNLPFFALVTVDGGHVINLQKKLTEDECNQDYELRFKFKGDHGSRFADSGSRDENTLKYLFHQCRHDFLHTRSDIAFSSTDEQDRINQVRVILCEIIVLSREYTVKPSSVLDKPKHYKIQHLLQKGLYVNRKQKEVKSHLRKFLHKFEQLDDSKLKREYIRYIENSQDYYVHRFRVHQLESSERNYNSPYELTISCKFAIKWKQIMTDPEQAKDKHAVSIVEKFDEVTMLEIDQVDSSKVYISRTTGRTEVFFAQSSQDAQSIVAIIDGYYKLLVNRYKVLINQGRYSTPKIHGPIARKRAESKIQEYGTEDGLFLIRQSRDRFDVYVLSLYCNKKCEHYHILKQDGGFYLEDTTRRFEDLNALIQYHEKNKDGLVCCLVRNCPPSDEGIDALLDGKQDVPTSDRPQDLTEFGVNTIESTTIRQLTLIGQGEYGKVIQADWRRYEKERTIKVAIRLIKRTTYGKEFFSVVKDLLNLKHPNVIRCYGMVKMKFENDTVLGLVLEHGSETIDTYLLEKSKRHPEKLTVKLIVQYALQVAEGMMFLQDELNYTHGRLCAQSILVPKDPTNIKICDVGLLELRERGGQFYSGKEKQDRHCWLAPELLVSSEGRPTHQSDVWSLGVTMWEMFTVKKPFHDKTGKPISKEKILHLLTTRKTYLDTERSGIPREVALVIEKCWERIPEDRTSFQRIMDKLRGFLGNQDSQEQLSKLLTTNDTYVESWEKQPDTAKTKTTVLLPATDGDNYSVVPSDKSKPTTLATPGPSNGTSRSLTNLQFIPRKESIHRTLSDPVSPTNIYDEPLMKKFRGFLERPSSLSQLLSSPPSNQTGDDNDDNKYAISNISNFPYYVVGDRGSITTQRTNTHGHGDDASTFQTDEMDSPNDESLPETHPHLSSVSSVEERAMAFLQGLNVEQKSSISTSLSSPPSPSSPTGTPGEKLTSEIAKPNLLHQETPKMTSEDNEHSELEINSDAAMTFLASKQKTDEDVSPYTNWDNKGIANSQLEETPKVTSEQDSEENTDCDAAMKFLASMQKPKRDFNLSTSFNSEINTDSQLEETPQTTSEEEEHSEMNDAAMSFLANMQKPETEVSSLHPIVNNETNTGSPVMFTNKERCPSDDTGYIKNTQSKSTTEYIQFPDNQSLLQFVRFHLNDPDHNVGPSLSEDSGDIPDHHIPANVWRSGDSDGDRAEKPPSDISNYSTQYQALPGTTSVSSYISPDSARCSAQNITGKVDIDEDTEESLQSDIVDDSLRSFVNHHLHEEDSITKSTERATGCKSTLSYVVPNSGTNCIETSASSSTDTEGIERTAQVPTEIVPGNLQSFISHHLNEDGSVTESAKNEDTITDQQIPGHNQNFGHFSATDFLSPSICPEKDPFGYIQPVVTQEVHVPLESLITELKLGTGVGNGNKNVKASVVKGGNCEHDNQPVSTKQSGPDNSSVDSGPVKPSTVPSQDSTVLEDKPLKSGCDIPYTVVPQTSGSVNPGSNVHQSFLLSCPFDNEMPADEDVDHITDEPMDEDTIPCNTETVASLPLPVCGGWFCEETIDQQDHETLSSEQPAFGTFVEGQRFGHPDPTMQDISQQGPNIAHSIGDLQCQQSSESGNLKKGPRKVQHNPFIPYTMPPGILHLPSTNKQEHIEPVRSESHDLQKCDVAAKEKHGTVDGQQAFGDQNDEPQHNLSMLVEASCSSHESEGIEMTEMPQACPLDETIDVSMENTGTSSDDNDVQDNMRKTSIAELKEDLHSSFIIHKQNLQFVGSCLGDGHFGVVRKAILKQMRFGSTLPTEREVAVKELRKAALTNKSREDFFQEARSMARLSTINHANIIKFIGVCIVIEDDKVMIVTELAPLGNLKNYLNYLAKQKDPRTIKRITLLDYCVQICCGMAMLEKEDILHRDLALRNILVVREDLVKISDFGLSKLSLYYKSEQPGKWPIKWYAPESIEFNRFTSKSDVWSFGVTMWEVFTYGKERPYPDIEHQKMLQHIKDKNRLAQPEGCPDDIYKVMMDCWHNDPKDRLSFYLTHKELVGLKNKYTDDYNFNKV